jgi:probable rRNA maturation factor
VDEPQLLAAARRVLEQSSFSSAVISLAVVDDATIHALNLRFLAHDYPTDVLSFELDRRGDHLEGEVVVSAETAVSSAAQWGWSAAEELLLYVIHGMLHLVGHGDKSAADAQQMRAAEERHLRASGIHLRQEKAAHRGGENLIHKSPLAGGIGIP